MPRHLILFLRAPLLGAGKRRLAREIGDLAAVRFERAMIALLLRRLANDRRWHLRLAVTPDRAPRQHDWRRRGRLHAASQGSGDLGARMLRALRACPPGPAVLVGTDIPCLHARHIWAAFRRLGACDLVFGPAADGGFWLVGARHPQQLPPLFEGVRWSTCHALADTLASLPRRFAVGFVDRLEDVDDADAHHRLAPTRGF
jgi:uncharacterized protein